MTGNQQYVLMVVGDEDDQFITNTTLSELDYHIPIRFLPHSNRLMEYLAANEEPVLVVLDYNAQPLNAVELLRQLKSDSAKQHIPVVILSNIASPEYVKECYSLGAASFIVKPAGIEATRDKIDTFFKYWFSVAEI